MLYLTLSGDVYCFVPNIVKSTLFSEQLSLFDPRVNNKSNQIYFYKSSVRFTTVTAFLFSGPFYPSRVVDVYFSSYFLNKAIKRNIFLEQSYQKKQILYDINYRQISAFKYRVHIN